MKFLTLTVVSFLLIGLTMSGTAYSQVPVWEREALIAFYNATGGDNLSIYGDPIWPGSWGWNGAVGTECDWHGVTCGSGVVTELVVHNLNLTGSIPAELGNLTALIRLDLNNYGMWSGGNLSGPIPSELGNLTNLTTLILAGNKFTGSIPPELGNLSELEELDLSNNELTGSIPSELGNFTYRLSHVDLSNNKLTGSIPPELGAIKYLHLSHNQLTGSIPVELGNVSYYLHLDNNQLTGFIPAALGNIVHSVHLNGNQLSGAIPSSLSPASDPCQSCGRSVNVSNNPKLDRNILMKLYSSTYALNWTNKTGWAGNAGTECDWYGVTCSGDTVTGLHLASNNLVGTIPPELGDLTTLTTLNLSSNSLTGSIPTQLSNLTALTELRLDNNKLVGPLPQWLSDMSISTLNVTAAFTAIPDVYISGGNRTIADTDGIAGESVSFTGTAVDSDGTIATTEWLVGGSVVATGSNPSIALPNGSTVVTFKATDNAGASSTKAVTITVGTPTYTGTDEWPSPYNGVTPDSSLGLAFNNIGIYDAAGSTIYTCLRVFTDGLPGSVSGIGEFDIGLTIVSLNKRTVQLTKFREFNVIGALNENVELPDCSGKFETTTGVFTDTIETNSYLNFLGNLLPVIKTFNMTFDLVDGDNLILKLSSYQELTAD